VNLLPLIDWLNALPASALYSAMFALAVIENIFPPVPSDTLVAFGSLLASRQGASPLPAFLCVFAGNVGSAFATYLLGRRWGTARMRRNMHVKGNGTEQRVRDLYARYGLPALFVSRFLPGVRALVPPIAGALHVPFLGAASMIALASAVWYGLIAFVSFRVGQNLDAVTAAVTQLGRTSAIISLGVVLLVGGAWLLRRRAKRVP
jgi:membrane protein DedA with SNARE-associated domain